MDFRLDGDVVMSRLMSLQIWTAALIGLASLIVCGPAVAQQIPSQPGSLRLKLPGQQPGTANTGQPGPQQSLPPQNLPQQPGQFAPGQFQPGQPQPQPGQFQPGQGALNQALQNPNVPRQDLPVPNGPPQGDPKQVLVPFRLTTQEYAELNLVLTEWEKRSSKIVNLKCEFSVWQTNNTFKTVTEKFGELMYQAPDKGFYHERFEKVIEKGPEGDVFKWEKKATLPHWASNGTSIFEVKHTEAKVIEHVLPENLKGEAIRNGPLPFIFVAKADQVKNRYFLRVISTEFDREKKRVLLEIFPRYQQDAANFRRAEVILTEENFMPLGLKMVDPSGESETMYGFGKYEINSNPTIFQNVVRLFKYDPFAPHPSGYTRVVETAPAAATASTPQPNAQTPRPSILNMFRPKGATSPPGSGN